jgi:hypothetical protein
VITVVVGISFQAAPAATGIGGVGGGGATP